MSALKWALSHPGNRGRRRRALQTWVLHNLRRRLNPGTETSVALGNGRLVGPRSHPIICLVSYVHRGLYDREAFAVLDALLEAGDTFIDVGANIGSYAVIAGQRVGPSGLVIAVEPVAGEFTFLQRNLARAGTPYLALEVALSHTPGRGVVLDGGAATGFLSEADENDDQSVPVSTLDQVIEAVERDWSRSLLKIDVEGLEPAVIAGAAGWLGLHPKGVLFEANGLQQQRSPVAWEQAVALLHTAGYEFVWPDERSGLLHRFPDPPAKSPFENYLAVRRDLAPVLQSRLAN